MARGRKVTLRLVETGGDSLGGEGRSEVHIVQGRRFEAIDEAEQHLISRDPGLFQRADYVVRVAPQRLDLGAAGKVEGLRIVEVKNEHMRLRFNRACDLRKFDKRTESWISVDCPKDFAQAYLEHMGRWQLPHLRAIATAPTLRPDGSLLSQPGYDAASGIYYDPRGVSFPEVPRAPTRDDALAALDRLETLFATLDLVDDVSRSAALSAVMTPILRSALAAAPMHGVTAPVAGSGKSKIVNLAAILATGHPTPVIALGPREEESEKRLGAELIEGAPIIAIDNAVRPIGGDFLCQAITEPIVAPRLLGASRTVKVVNAATWYATGNNLKFVGDMVRRTLLIRLDPGCEQPELREFEAPDPLTIARAERPVLVTAVLTIVQAFRLAGHPREVPALGSFGDWSRWVRDPLIWLGRPDPVLAMSEARRDDPILGSLLAVIEQWRAVLGDQRVTCRHIAETANEHGLTGFSHGEFRDALLRVCGENGNISTRRLGQWLGQVKGRTVAGKRLIEAELLHGVMRWRLDFATQGLGG
ncbi:MAG TPA: hypothetical protein VN808_16935 [Stellaceae bacterium]|nr:hypothetical protein [Stellaceae bacterium]